MTFSSWPQILNFWATAVFTRHTPFFTALNDHPWNISPVSSEQQKYQTLFISSSLPDSAEREIAFCPSIRLTSWSLGTQLEKSSLRLLTSSKPKRISFKRRKCQNCLCDSSFSYFISSTALVALFTPFIFSPWQHFFFFFGSVRTLSTWLLLVAVPRRCLPGLRWPLLISKVLRVSSCSLNNAPRSQSGADRPRAGHLSWSFILLTWVSFDMWGRLWLSGRFWASLMCLPYSDLMGTMGLLYSRGTKWRNTPLASHI